jgi:hypothetical protein
MKAQGKGNNNEFLKVEDLIPSEIIGFIFQFTQYLKPRYDPGVNSDSNRKDCKEYSCC